MTKLCKNTGVCPVKSDYTEVGVTYADGTNFNCNGWASDILWELVGDSSDILYYKILTPETEKVQ
jgi:hypothetical protein